MAYVVNHGLYLTNSPHPSEPGKILAIITDGQTRCGSPDMIVLTLDVFNTAKEALQWFERCKIERPWDKGN